MKVPFIEKMVNVHMKLEDFETGTAGEKEELDHLRGVTTGLLPLLEVAVLGVVVIEGQVELAEISEVVAGGFEDVTILDLKADDPEEAKLYTVGGDAE